MKESKISILLITRVWQLHLEIPKLLASLVTPWQILVFDGIIIAVANSGKVLSTCPL